MGKPKTWITPFKKQCFVTAGVTLNMAQFGLIMGFTSSLLPQLRRPDSAIQIDDSAGSWIASAPAITILPASFIVPVLMEKCGRKVTHLISLFAVIFGWFLIVLAKNVSIMIFARLIQGFALGMASCTSPMLIGEYTSPRNRGAFLTMISLIIAAGTHVAHTMGSYLVWETCALICALIGFGTLVIVLYSPESPSWLISKGRYEEGMRVFRWLRGDDEEDELQKMIEANINTRQTKTDSNMAEPFGKRMKSRLGYLTTTVKKSEFYKPIFIMIHLNILIYLTGVNMLTTYAEDIYSNIMGNEVNIALLTITVDTQRLISNTCAIYVVKKVRRKPMLLVTVCLNIFAYLATAGYSYAKGQGIIDQPIIGILLIHLHMFSIAGGSMPLPLIIAGEIFPLQYRSIGSGISTLLNSPTYFILIKTLPGLFRTIGLHGAFCIYGVLLAYCLVMSWIFLPETKDKTLQDIEEEFKGKRADDVAETQSLTARRLSKSATQ